MNLPPLGTTVRLPSPSAGTVPGAQGRLGSQPPLHWGELLWVRAWSARTPYMTRVSAVFQGVCPVSQDECPQLVSNVKYQIVRSIYGMRPELYLIQQLRK